MSNNNNFFTELVALVKMIRKPQERKFQKVENSLQKSMLFYAKCLWNIHSIINFAFFRNKRPTKKRKATIEEESDDSD